ncbi:hypothetical protein B9T25_06405 [Acinetobacter sp. ANC 4470]|uniref:hypothetical protein n=1 Tax=Acinetobacter sp. ANC 4470 TaxID=1977881 RepID=UPI000A33E37A|nr:hypothetical protein [Acinetobacter sp. ANC 4470]OTG68309.1 hypothetical protein B9T25_06405 [Acinetobacter sp. ANC 4470]
MGATFDAHFTDGTGAFHITVNDQLFQNPDDWGVGYMMSKIPELNNIIEGNGDGDFYCTNKSENFIRVKFKPLSGDYWGVKESNMNPTIDIDDEGVIQFCLAPKESVEPVCIPTVLYVPDMTIPEIGMQYKYSYRVNGGAVITKNENAGGAPAKAVFVNILGYYGFFDDLVTTNSGQKAFLAMQDLPIQGGSVDHPNFVQAQSNTIEFLLTPNAEHDLIQTIFGEDITLHSCALVNWNIGT